MSEFLFHLPDTKLKQTSRVCKPNRPFNKEVANITCSLSLVYIVPLVQYAAQLSNVHSDEYCINLMIKRLDFGVSLGINFGSTTNFPVSFDVS